VKRTVLSPFLALAVACSAFAQTVSVAIIEIDADRGSIAAHTERVLGGCLEGLFAAGFIATNAAPLEGKEADFDGGSVDLEAAKEGSADFLLVVELAFRRSKLDALREFPASCRWRLVDLSNARTLETGRLDGPPDTAVTINAAPRVLREFGIAIVDAALPSMAATGENVPAVGP